MKIHRNCQECRNAATADNELPPCEQGYECDQNILESIEEY